MMERRRRFSAGKLEERFSPDPALGAVPWRMTAADHAEALASAAADGRQLPKLRGPVPDATWDPALAPAIRSCGVKIEEELAIDVLLADLAPQSQHTRSTHS